MIGDWFDSKDGFGVYVCGRVNKGKKVCLNKSAERNKVVVGVGKITDG